MTGQRLTDENGAAVILNVEPPSLRAWRRKGQGPPYLRIGRLIRYSIEDLEEWLAQRRFTSSAHERSCAQKCAPLKIEDKENG